LAKRRERPLTRQDKASTLIWLWRNVFEQRRDIAPRLPDFKITGIGLCMASISSLGSVVMMVKVSIRFPSGFR
jgi:hypothetical protein